MARYNLTTIRPKGFLHVSAFAEVKDSLAWALTSLGHEAVLTENSFSAGASTNVIFGAELLPPTQQIPPNSIIYNLEQPTHPRLEGVRQLAERQKLLVWDYSERNVRDWLTRGLPAVHLPIGYTPNLTRVPKASVQDIDVTFLGWMTPRRVQLIHDLRAAGLNVYAADNCYGGARDQVLSRTKVCLNVHHDGRDMFEIVRVSYLLANGKCVLSELSSDDDDYSDVGGLTFRDRYDCLVTSAKILVDNIKMRESYEIEADKFKTMDFTASVERVLDTDSAIDRQGAIRTPATITAGAIRTRFSRACSEGDMADFAQWLHDHAYGQILEIGVRDGASTSAFLLGLEANDPRGHLTSIDIDDRSSLWRHPQWTFIRDNSLQVRFPDSTFDIVLIDGDHMQPAYRGDLYNAWHWTKPGGLILSHDIKPERGHEFYAVGIREEWDKFIAMYPGVRHYILPGKYGLGVIHKPRAAAGIPA